MTQKIRILTINQYGRPQHVSILRSRLKEYTKVTQGTRKATWVLTKNIKRLKARLNRARGYTLREGVTKQPYARQYAYARFNLRRKLVNEQTAESIVQQCKKKYESVKNLRKDLEMQRVTISLSDADKEKVRRINRITGKKRFVEQLDERGTVYYERDPRSTKAMFRELEGKLNSYLDGSDGSIRLLSDEEDKYAVHFIVHYSTNQVIA